MYKKLAIIAAAQFLLVTCMTACDQSAPPKPPKPIAEQAQQPDSRP